MSLSTNGEGACLVGLHKTVLYDVFYLEILVRLHKTTIVLYDVLYLEILVTLHKTTIVVYDVFYLNKMLLFHGDKNGFYIPH